MSDQEQRTLIHQAYDAGGGVFRLAPTWVPRSFCVPGRRLRLDTRDLYALGAHRGGIDERWFASTTKAENGPLTLPDEGLSYIVGAAGRVTLADAIGLEGQLLLGKAAMDLYGGWVMYSKFFDNFYPLPHHIHQSDEMAALVNKRGKPESYYFPPQYNFANDFFPYTFFGLEPGTTKDQVIDCLRRWNEGDNGILRISKAYRLTPGTGWDVPPGILHAPGTLCTYEPQRASDVFSMWQSLLSDFQLVEWEMVVKDVPPEYHHDYDFLIGLLDWDKNVDPYFVQNRFLEPILIGTMDAAEENGYHEKWITYNSDYYSAKELTVYPGRTVTIKDPAAYGTITMQGYGKLGALSVSAPSLIRFGEMTEDEFFVTVQAAQQGLTITNLSGTEPLVMLKHFNPGNPDRPMKK
jgi:hypothetical protein